MTNLKTKLLLVTVSLLAVSACGQDAEEHQEAPSSSIAGTHPEQAQDDHGDEDHDGDDHGEDEHDDDDHGDEHGESAEVHLSQDQIDALGIAVSPVARGAVDGVIELPAEVGFDQNHLAHVSPRVSGVVRSVNIAEGDRVRAGDVLAVLSSRTLADAKAGYLSARARLDLAQSSFQREERLWERQISAEQDFLDARRALEEARIDVRSAGQQLDALGIDVARE